MIIIMGFETDLESEDSSWQKLLNFLSYDLFFGKNVMI